MFRVICPVSISHATRLRFQCVIVCGLACWNLGCDKGPQAEFKLRDSTNDLILDANKAVKKTLKEDFGTPNELVAWERFPINYGGAKGAVASIADNKSIIVTVEGDSSKIRQGAPILWVTGSLAGDKAGRKRRGQFQRRNEATRAFQRIGIASRRRPFCCRIRRRPATGASCLHEELHALSRRRRRWSGANRPIPESPSTRLPQRGLQVHVHTFGRKAHSRRS